MEENEQDDKPLGMTEAFCALCSATFLVKLVRASESPVSLVYEGRCGQCEGMAMFTYVAATKKLDGA